MKKYIIFSLLAILVILTTLLGGCAKAKYAVTIATSGQGTTNPGAGTYTYEAGTPLTVTATPDTGWKFDGWTGRFRD